MYLCVRESAAEVDLKVLTPIGFFYLFTASMGNEGEVFQFLKKEIILSSRLPENGVLKMHFQNCLFSNPLRAKISPPPTPAVKGLIIWFITMCLLVTLPCNQTIFVFNPLSLSTK